MARKSFNLEDIFGTQVEAAREKAVEIAGAVGSAREVVAALAAEEACHALCRRRTGLSLDGVIDLCERFRDRLAEDGGALVPSGQVLLALLEDDQEEGDSE